MSDIFFKKFFLASHTCEGFFSLFNQLYCAEKGWFCYILKGGPGTGKSTLMKKIANAAAEKHSDIELVYCSSDPNSLDAVIIPEIKTCIADGTSPHIIEPKHPGISEKIINLGEFWSEKKLQKNSKNLINLFTANKQHHDKAAKLLKALGDMRKSANSISKGVINNESLKSYTEKLLKSIFKKNKSNTVALEQMRLLDAITPHGHLFFEESITQGAENIYIIEDKYELASNEILQTIRREAINKKIEFISFPSPFFPSKCLRAVSIPEISTVFIAKKPNTEAHILNNLKTAKKINTTQFLNSEALKSHKNLLGLYEKSSAILLEKSVEHLNRALEIHDDIEKFYIAAMNHKKINKIADKLISTIL